MYGLFIIKIVCISFNLLDVYINSVDILKNI